MTVELAEPPARPRQRTIVRWYVGAAILLFNTLLFFVLLNLICWAALGIHQLVARPSYLTYPDDWYRKAYPTMADSEWKELVKETKERPFGFEPYAMFTEPAYRGQYVNISEQGFRIVPHQGPWPMDPKNYNVLTFGGSTMFGYAVSDDQTIPAYLQAIMQKNAGRRVCIYNFGRRAYYSTQERVVFEQLLRDGAKPDLVIFMDGLNDFLFAVEPTFLQQSQDELLAPLSSGSRLLQIWQSLPAGEAVQLLSKNFMPATQSPPKPDVNVVDPPAISRYAWNKKAIEAIAAAQGIATVFVFQPTPTYKNDEALKDHDWSAYGDRCTIAGYPLMARYAKDNNMGSDFLWLADIQEGIQTSLYVDKWHYTPEFSREIADEIVKFLTKQKVAR